MLYQQWTQTDACSLDIARCRHPVAETWQAYGGDQCGHVQVGVGSGEALFETLL